MNNHDLWEVRDQRQEKIRVDEIRLRGDQLKVVEEKSWLLRLCQDKSLLRSWTEK